MNRIDRLFAILLVLQNETPIRAQDLHNHKALKNLTQQQWRRVFGFTLERAFGNKKVKR